MGPLSAGVANLHPYPGGLPPERDGRLERQLALARQLVSPTAPVWATEAGYHTGTGSQPGVSERAAGIYTPRLVLAHFRAGFSKTFLYELADQGRDASNQRQDARFGLLRFDLSDKPASLALSRLIRLMADGGQGGRPRRLAYAVDGDLSGLHQLPLGRCDGGFRLAVWRDDSVYDVSGGRDLSPAARPAALRLGRPASAVRVHDLNQGGRPAVIRGSVRTVPLAVGPQVQVVELPGHPAVVGSVRARNLPRARSRAALRRTVKGLERAVQQLGAGCLSPRPVEQWRWQEARLDATGWSC